MRVGNHWVHGTPSGSSVFSSIFGSASGAGPASAQNGFRTKGEQSPDRIGPSFDDTCLLHSNGHVSNDTETHPRSRPNAAPPGGRPQGISAQRNTTAPAEGQSTTGPTPYPRIYARSVRQFLDVYFSKRARDTSHCNYPVLRTLGYRSWALPLLSFGSCLSRFSCTVRQRRADNLRHISGG
jgi:hypothetical protein